MINKVLTPIFVGAIRAYQICLAPFFGGHCRFFPSCSEYAREAVRAHGIFSGILKTATRLLRCHPWADGGYDPVSK